MSTLSATPHLRDTPAPRHVVAAWTAWDFGSNAFNTVMWSFVFSVYVTSGLVAPSKDIGQMVWTYMQLASGVLLALLAPLMGAWADRVANRRLMLTVATIIVAVAMAACWFVYPHPNTLMFVLLGTALLAFASLVQEIAGVFYNGMLAEIATAKTIGRISGTGWAAGYFGGVLCLIVALFGFVQGGPHGTGLLGLSAHESTNLRAIAPFCALFLLLASVPIMVWGPTPKRAEIRPGHFSIVGSYRAIFSRIKGMWREERTLLHFLVASAVFRDGLAAVFAFAGVIAATTFGFTAAEVIVFGIAANLVAAVGTWALGRVDDWWGPKNVIVFSLIVMIVAGTAIIGFQTKSMFWVGGLTISSMVGAVQSAARTMLTRMTPAQRQNETFGLYATVGRAVSFIAPAFVAAFSMLLGTQYGLLGIVVTLILGLALTIPLRFSTPDGADPSQPST